MNNTRRKIFSLPRQAVSVTHATLGSHRRLEAENFIKHVFAKRYNAQVSAFTPNLMLLEQCDRIVAAAGWRSASATPLFLERYLNQPIEQVMAQLAQPRVKRENIVEVGHLASEKAGGSLLIVHALASHLSAQGFEWVVFTATQELIGIFSKLGLPLLALAIADPERLRDAASHWGSYYDTQPIVVAGRIKLGLQRLELAA
jgi:hypothetical protein